jgi:hypothetical protein
MVLHDAVPGPATPSSAALASIDEPVAVVAPAGVSTIILMSTLWPWNSSRHANLLFSLAPEATNMLENLLLPLEIATTSFTSRNVTNTGG